MFMGNKNSAEEVLREVNKLHGLCGAESEARIREQVAEMERRFNSMFEDTEERIERCEMAKAAMQKLLKEIKKFEEWVGEMEETLKKRAAVKKPIGTVQTELDEHFVSERCTVLGYCTGLSVLGCLYWVVCTGLSVLGCLYWVIVLGCLYWVVCTGLSVLDCLYWVVCTGLLYWVVCTGLSVLGYWGGFICTLASIGVARELDLVYFFRYTHVSL